MLSFSNDQPSLRETRRLRRLTARWWAAAALLPWLAACGGGDAPGPAPVTAEGLWRGTTSDGQSATLLILGDGRTWSFFTRDAALTGALALQLYQAGSNFSVAGSGLGIGYTLPPGQFSGNVQTGQTLNFRFSNGTRFDLAYSSAYTSPGSIAAIAGSYSLAGRTGTHTLLPTPVQLDAQGTFSVSSSGCTMAGTLRPAGDGKGYFDTRVAFSGTCSVFPAGTSLEGITLVDTAVSPRTLVALVVKADAHYLLTLQGVAATAY